jgi:hypothetical protein
VIVTDHNVLVRAGRVLPRRARPHCSWLDRRSTTRTASCKEPPAGVQYQPHVSTLADDPQTPSTLSTTEGCFPPTHEMDSPFSMRRIHGMPGMYMLRGHRTWNGLSEIKTVLHTNSTACSRFPQFMLTIPA